MTAPDNRPFSRHTTPQEDALAEEAIVWFGRMRASHVSQADRQAFEAWKRRSPAHARAFEEVCAFWEDADLTRALTETPLGASRPDRFAAPRRRSWRLRALAAAVAVCLLALAGATFDPVTRFQADYWTSTGEQRIIRLVDGSTVTLNTASALAAHVDDAVRRIRLLKGEAFFDVQADATRPFVVESRAAITQAIGTQFLVREAAKGDTITVIAGRVEIVPKHRSHPRIRLHHGQQVDVGPEDPGQPKTIKRHIVTAWLRGRLLVENMPLAAVMEEVQRYRPGYVIFTNPATRDLRVNGNFSLADPHGILDTLDRTLPITMVRLTDWLIVVY